MRVRGIPSGGKVLSYGPSRNVNFPFVLLGRALLHHRLVSKRTHAVRDELDLTKPALDWMSDRERRKLARIFEDIRDDRKSSRRRVELAEMVLAWCVAVDDA